MDAKFTGMIAAGLLMGCGGFFAGRISSSPATEDDKSAPAEARSGRVSGRDGRGSLAETISRDARKSRTGSTSRQGEDRLVKLEALMRGEDPLARNRALLDFIDQLGPNDFESAVAKFRGLGMTEGRMGEYSLLLAAWAKADPVSALDYAAKSTQGGFARDTVLTAWATADPEAAIRWAQANHQGDDANPHLAGIIRGLAGSDPTRATDLLASMPRSEERGRGLEFMLPHLLQKGPDAAREWITSIQDGALKDGAISRAARQLANEDPAGTAAWLLANPGEGARRRVDDVFGIWAQKDPQAALANFTSMPAGDLRSDALRGLVRSTAAADPKAALSMMDRYPRDVNDSVVQNFVWHSIGTDPAMALAQIPRIGDARQQEQTYSRTLDVWLQRDPASAQAWLQTNPVPESVRNRIARRQTPRN